MRIIVLLSALLACGATLSARPTVQAESFRSINSDGSVFWVLQANKVPLNQRIINKFDVNRDGIVDEDEKARFLKDIPPSVTNSLLKDVSINSSKAERGEYQYVHMSMQMHSDGKKNYFADLTLFARAKYPALREKNMFFRAGLDIDEYFRIKIPASYKITRYDGLKNTSITVNRRYLIGTAKGKIVSVEFERMS